MISFDTIRFGDEYTFKKLTPDIREQLEQTGYSYKFLSDYETYMQGKAFMVTDKHSTSFTINSRRLGVSKDWRISKAHIFLCSPVVKPVTLDKDLFEL